MFILRFKGEAEVGPIYGVPLIDSLPISKEGFCQAMPSRHDLEMARNYHERLVAGYEVLLSHFILLNDLHKDITSPNQDLQMQHMTEPELAEHLNRQLRFIKSCQTSDTIGAMLIIFQTDGVTQYGATVDPETAPQALRELADRIERRQTVKRQP